MYSYKSLLKAWDEFFFTPRPTEGIACFRIVWYSILFLIFLVELPHIEFLYGVKSVASLKAMKSYFSYPHVNLFHWLGVDSGILVLFMTVYGLALVCAILGFHTRLAMVVVMICLTSIHQRNIMYLSSSELLMRTISLMMIFSPAGHSLSVDSILGRSFIKYRKERDWAPWVWRLIIIQLSVVYLWTVWHKLKGDTWFDGTAVYYASRIENMRNFSLPILMDSMWFLKMSTWGTLLTELALGTLIWFNEFRRPLIYAGIIFHLGIEFLMSIPFFEVIMIALLLNFFTPEEYRNFVLRLKLRLAQILEQSTLPPKAKEWLLFIVVPK